MEPRHLWYKLHQNATPNAGKPAIANPRSPRISVGSQHDLFDGDGKPRDQPRHLVQTGGIAFTHRAREPVQAFLIAHRGDVVRDNRGHGPGGLDVWHRITLLEKPAVPNFVREWVYFWSDLWRPRHAASHHAALPARPQRATNHGGASRFPARAMPAANGIFGPLQAPEALLYAARVRKIVFAYSSVAQR
jgi:hypothetical protein